MGEFDVEDALIAIYDKAMKLDRIDILMKEAEKANRLFDILNKKISIKFDLIENKVDMIWEFLTLDKTKRRKK